MSATALPARRCFSALRALSVSTLALAALAAGVFVAPADARADEAATSDADTPLPVKKPHERAPMHGGKPGKLGRLGPQSDMDISDADGGEEREGGDLVIRRWTLQPRALMVSQAGIYTGEDNQQNRGDRMERPGFALRRARFGFAGTYGESTTFGLFADLAGLLSSSGNSNLLSEAWVSTKTWSSSSIIIGAHRTPYSKSAMASSGQLALAERSHAAIAMAPFRQVGVTLTGAYETAGLQWHLGVYNGFEQGSRFYAGVKEFSGLQGNKLGAAGGKPALLGVGRISAAPLGDMGADLADSKHSDFRFEIGANAYYNYGGSTVTTGYGADLHAKVKGLHVLLEYLADMSSPKDKPTSTSVIPASLMRSAFIAEAGYQWKRLLVSARAELIDPNTDIDDNDDELLTSGCIGYTTPGNRTRLMLQYDHRTERNGLALDNDTLFAHLQLML